jgi:transcriptional regulator with XRE-family HTH domain
MTRATQPAKKRRGTPMDRHVGQRLRQRRLELDLTLEQLADLLGVSTFQTFKYETGDNRISASRLYDLSLVLAVPVSWFFVGVDVETDRDDTSASALRQLVSCYTALPDEAARAKLLDLVKVFAAPDLTPREGNPIRPDTVPDQAADRERRRRGHKRNHKT